MDLSSNLLAIDELMDDYDEELRDQIARGEIIQAVEPEKKKSKKKKKKKHSKKDLESMDEEQLALIEEEEKKQAQEDLI